MNVPPATTIAGRSISDYQQALDSGRAAEVRPLLEREATGGRSTALAAALLARTYLALGEKQKAALAAAQAEKSMAGNGPVQHTLALYFASVGNRKRAAELEALFARSPEADEEAAARAALLFHQARQFDSALQLGEQALPQSRRPELALMVAQTRQARREWEPCFRAYARLRELLPYDFDAWAASGEAYLRAERFEDGVKLLEQARELFPRSAQIQLSLGVAYYGQRRFEQAARQFLAASDIAPEAEQPYVFLGRMLDQLAGRAEEILNRLDKWAASEKSNPQAPLVLAKALAAFAPDRMGAEGEALLREAVRRGPKLWETHFELGCALETNQKLAEAVRELEAAAALSPKEAPIHYRLARLYTRLGDPTKAAAARARHQALTAATSTGGMK